MTHSPSELPEREQRLGEIVFACLQAIDTGQHLPRQDLLDRHPEFASALAEFFADRDRVQRLAQPLFDTSQPGPAGQTRVFSPNADPGDKQEPLPAGTRIGYFGDFELLEEIGQGGMGIVYKARQLSLHRWWP